MQQDRLNLPFTGLATFAKVPYQPDLLTLDADVAIVGAPYDMGTQVRSGTRYGPRGIRNASTIYGMRTPRYYDSEFDEIYLEGVRIVDVGDADMIHGRPDACLANIQATTEAILARNALPVTLAKFGVFVTMVVSNTTSTMLFTTLISPTAVLSGSGDQCTITESVTQ